jgi:glycerol uptake facilitator protein
MDLNLGGIFLSEMLGTFFLILIGCGVNASVNLKKTYSNNSG